MKIRVAVTTGVIAAFVTLLTLQACGHVNAYRTPDLPLGTRNPPEFFGELLHVPKQSLCLSGGGYRAMLFHLGVLWRLNELGLLPTIDEVESVSGGSIVAAQLVLNWNKLQLQLNDGVSPFFKSVVAYPILNQADRSIDFKAIALGLIIPGQSPSSMFAKELNGATLYNGKTMNDLPDSPTPTLSLVSTDLASGAPWVFKRAYMGPEAWGSIRLHGGNVRIADAVAASAGFPPFLSPAEFEFINAESRFTQDQTSIDPNVSDAKLAESLQKLRRASRVKLADGGLVNNLGSASCELADNSVISDASNPVSDSKVFNNWAGQYYRITNLMYQAKERRLRGDVTNPTSHPNRIYISLHRLDDEEVHRDLQWDRDQIARVIAPYIGGDHISAEDQQRIDKLASIVPDDRAPTDLGEFLSRYESIAMDNIEDTRLRKVKLKRMQALVNLGYIQTSIAVAKYFVIAEIELIVNRDKCGCDSKDFERSTFWAEHSDQFREFMATIPEPVFTSKMALPCPIAATPTKLDYRGAKSNRRAFDPADACRGAP